MAFVSAIMERVHRRTRAVVSVVSVALATAPLAACSGSRAVSLPPDPRFTTTPTATSVANPPGDAGLAATGGAANDHDGDDDETRASTTPTTEPASTTTTDPVDGTILERIDWKAFDRSLNERLIGGGDQAASVAVAANGTLVHEAAYGERVPGEPARPEHRFRIASLSKTIMATAILRLVERDDLALDDRPLADLADELDVTIEDRRIKRITLRQLLGHTSGFGDFENEFFGAGVDSCAEGAQRALSGSLDFDPDASYNYSNMNYCLLGLVLESVTGKPFDDVLKTEVLEPLAIDSFRQAGTFDVRVGDVRHRTSPRRNYMETLGAAGSWLGTPADMVRVIDSLDPGKPVWHAVSARTAKLMKRPSSPNRTGASRTSWYGLGLIVYDDGSYGHTGTLENTHAMVLARPDGVTWAIFVSGENPWETSDLSTIIGDAFNVARTQD